MMNSKFENFQVQDIKPQQGLRKDCSCLLWLSKKVEQVHISCPPVAKNNVCLKVVAWQRQKPAYKLENAQDRKSTRLNSSPQAQKELAYELAKFHAEQALKYILKLPCSTEQKLELVDAVVKHIKSQT